MKVMVVEGLAMSSEAGKVRGRLSLTDTEVRHCASRHSSRRACSTLHRCRTREYASCLVETPRLTLLRSSREAKSFRCKGQPLVVAKGLEGMEEEEVLAVVVMVGVAVVESDEPAAVELWEPVRGLEEVESEALEQ